MEFPVGLALLTLVLKGLQIGGEILFVKRQNTPGHQEPFPWGMGCK